MALNAISAAVGHGAPGSCWGASGSVCAVAWSARPLRPARFVGDSGGRPSFWPGRRCSAVHTGRAARSVRHGSAAVAGKNGAWVLSASGCMTL
jgi:hypothetical protein